MTSNLLIFYLVAAIFVPVAHGLTAITIFLSHKYQKNISDANMAAGFFISAVIFVAVSCFIIRVIRPSSYMLSVILVSALLFLSILSVQQGFSRISLKNRAAQWFLNILFCACLSLMSGVLLK